MTNLDDDNYFCTPDKHLTNVSTQIAPWTNFRPPPRVRVLFFLCIALRCLFVRVRVPVRVGPVGKFGLLWYWTPGGANEGPCSSRRMTAHRITTIAVTVGVGAAQPARVSRATRGGMMRDAVRALVRRVGIAQRRAYGGATEWCGLVRDAVRA